MDTTPPTVNNSEIIDAHVKSFLDLIDQEIEKLTSEHKPIRDDT
ncbi:hypothetical protein [Cohnella hongkongensis]|uniref:Uncharacterized protein n=1 Tax=Cohnella hongkongensis TaxID=178337 RepID=A0ABV9F6P4_9BACL